MPGQPGAGLAATRMVEEHARWGAGAQDGGLGPALPWFTEAPAQEVDLDVDFASEIEPHLGACLVSCHAACFARGAQFARGSWGTCVCVLGGGGDFSWQANRCWRQLKVTASGSPAPAPPAAVVACPTERYAPLQAQGFKRSLVAMHRGRSAFVHQP